MAEYSFIINEIMTDNDLLSIYQDFLEIKGVEQVEINPKSKMLRIIYDNSIDLHTIKKAFINLGFVRDVVLYTIDSKGNSSEIINPNSKTINELFSQTEVVEIKQKAEQMDVLTRCKDLAQNGYVIMEREKASREHG